MKAKLPIFSEAFRRNCPACKFSVEIMCFFLVDKEMTSLSYFVFFEGFRLWGVVEEFKIAEFHAAIEIESKYIK